MDRINQVVAGCGNHHFTSQLIFSELKESMVMDDMLQCFPPKNAYRLKHLPTSSSSTNQSQVLRTSYVASLSKSMSLAMEEFYRY